MDIEDPRTIGRRVKQVRYARHKSLRVVAGLAGMSKSKLDRIERGEVALDKRSDIVALANALQVAPSDLTVFEVPAPGNGATDAAEEAVRLALLAVVHDHPGGQIVPADVLRTRVTAMLDARCRCDRQVEAGTLLPDLIRDVHTSIEAGRDVAELLELSVLLHTQGTSAWLRVVGAPLDLRSQAVGLARQAARELDAPTAIAIATGCARSLAARQYNAARRVLTMVDRWRFAGLAGLPMAHGTHRSALGVPSVPQSGVPIGLPRSPGRFRSLCQAACPGEQPPEARPRSGESRGSRDESAEPR